MWTKKIFVILGAAVFAVAVFESVYHVYKIRAERNKERGIYFLSADKPPIFSEGELFLRAPSTEVRVRGVYYDRKRIYNEFDYSYAANDLGLVQDFNVIAHKKTLLVLGDSFAEGLGAAPWFNRFARELTAGAGKDFQVLNGGASGTGFRQFGAVEKYLVRHDVNIQKLLILFISDDIRRPVFNPESLNIRCRPDFTSCNRTSGWMLVPSDVNIPLLIGRLRVQNAQAVAPSGHIPFFIQTLWRSEPAPFVPEPHLLLVRESVRKMLDKYGAKNVLFVHLPQKDEVRRGQPDFYGRLTRDMITGLGGRYFDGFSQCKLESRDFYPHDSHPNVSGYGKIEACVLAASKSLF